MSYETAVSDVAPSPRIALSGTPGKSWILWPQTKSTADRAAGVTFARLSPARAEAWARSLGGRLPTLEEARAAVGSAEAIVSAFAAWPTLATMRDREAAAWWDQRLAKALAYVPTSQPVFAAKGWLALSPWNPPDGHAPRLPAAERSENWGAWRRDGRPLELIQPGGWGSQDHDRAWTDYSQIPLAIFDAPPP